MKIVIPSGARDLAHAKKVTLSSLEYLSFEREILHFVQDDTKSAASCTESS
jgi:hypothetical protein